MLILPIRRLHPQAPGPYFKPILLGITKKNANHPFTMNDG
jgi:hypothetical protein